MKNIQLILIIAILILVYLISMQWLERDTGVSAISSTSTPQPIQQKIETIAPIVQETDKKASEIIKENEKNPETQINSPEETNTTEQTTNEQEGKTEDPKLIEYRNPHYGYYLSFPKKMYYAGFGPRGGAIHSLAIQEDSLPESFADASVRVFFYGKKILPELQNRHNNRYEDPNGKFVLLLLNNEYSVKIEAENLQSSTVKVIEETIGVDV